MKRSLNSTTATLAAFTACVSLLNACGSGDTSSSTKSDLRNAPPKLEVMGDEVRDPKGCLNVGQIFDRIQQTPEGTVVREVTTNFRIGDPTDRTPRPNYIRGLALKAYVFNETSPAELQKPKLVQVGCERVISQGAYGEAVQAKIESWNDNTIDLVYESRRETYELLSPTTLKIVRTGRALDDCNRQRILTPFETTTLLRWGTPENLEAQNEELGFSFAKVFTEALNESPLELGQALRHPYIDESGLEVIQLDPSLLRSLNSIEETVLTRRCSELPEATPTPAPTPRQAPVAKPRSIIEMFWDWFR